MQLDLDHLIRLARRWWWLLLIAPMLGGTTAFITSSRLPEQYSAEATLLLNAGVTGGMNDASIRAAQNLAETFSQLAVSRPVLERAAEELDDVEHVEALEDQVSSSTVPNTLFLKISANDTDPQQAAVVANTVAEQFVTYMREESEANDVQVRGNIEKQIDEMNRQIDEVGESIESLQAQPGPLNASDRENLDILLANRSLLQQKLAELQATAREMNIELASAQTRFIVSSRAVPPGEPYAPNVIRTTALGAFVGITLGVGALVLLEYLDNTVRSREEIRQITPAPVLATVGNAPEVQRGGHQLFVLGAPKSRPAEAMRLLRANVEFACAPDNIKSLVISSPDQDEGKSTLTANLGVVMAQAGFETVIIDADLRRPAQHHHFGVNNGPGLTTLLTHPDRQWADGALRLNIPGLTLIPSGPIPPNPSDLLSSERLGELIREISTSVDMVLVDTPPILAFSDALVVAAEADGALLVCRMGHTRRDALRRASSAFQQGAIRLIGLAINRDRNDDGLYDRYDQSPVEAESANRRFYYGSSRTGVPAVRPLPDPERREQSIRSG